MSKQEIIYFQREKMSKPKKSILTVYFAGPLFTIEELVGNQALVTEMEKVSAGRYKFFLPQSQSIELSHEAATIRQSDLNNVLAADLFLGNFNGPDLDSGTVAEFLTAKFADKPAVLLHSDFRVLTCPAGMKPIIFNSVLLGWPRTKVVVVDALAFYSANGASVSLLLQHVATLTVAALDEIAQTKPMFASGEKRCQQRQIVNSVLASAPQPEESFTYVSRGKIKRQSCSTKLVKQMKEEKKK